MSATTHFIRSSPTPVFVVGLGRRYVASCTCKWSHRSADREGLNEAISRHRGAIEAEAMTS